MLTGIDYEVVKDYFIDMVSNRVEDASEVLKDELQFDEKNLKNLKNSRNNIIKLN